MVRNQQIKGTRSAHCANKAPLGIKRGARHVPLGSQVLSCFIGALVPLFGDVYIHLPHRMSILWDDRHRSLHHQMLFSSV